MIVDTSALLAFFDGAEPDHAAVATALLDAEDLLVVSPYVVAELDYLLATRRGIDAELAALRELSGGAWELAHLGPEDLAQAGAVVERYRDQQIGVADASNVVLAARYRTRTIATLDHRHFRVLRAPDGGGFTLVPPSLV